MLTWVVCLRPECEHAQQDHLKTRSGVGRKRQVALPDQANLVVKLNVLRANLVAKLQYRVTVTFRIMDAGRHKLANRNTMQQTQQVV